MSAFVHLGATDPENRDLPDRPFEDRLQIEIRCAGKRDERIRDIPASVTLLTREEIARWGSASGSPWSTAASPSKP